MRYHKPATDTTGTGGFPCSLDAFGTQTVATSAALALARRQRATRNMAARNAPAVI